MCSKSGAKNVRAQIPTIPAWPGPNRPETARAEEVAGILVGLRVRLFKTRKLCCTFSSCARPSGENSFDAHTGSSRNSSHSCNSNDARSDACARAYTLRAPPVPVSGGSLLTSDHFATQTRCRLLKCPARSPTPRKTGGHVVLKKMGLLRRAEG